MSKPSSRSSSGGSASSRSYFTARSDLTPLPSPPSPLFQLPPSASFGSHRRANGVETDILVPTLSNRPLDVDPQILEALKSKDRNYVLMLGELMEDLINDQKNRIDLRPSTSYQRLLLYLCCAFYKLAPETDPASKGIAILLTPESRIPPRRLRDLIPVEATTQPASKFIRRSGKAQLQVGSGEDADLSDVVPFESGSPVAWSNVAPSNSSKKQLTIEEREAAHNEAHSRIFVDFEVKDDVCMSSSSLSSVLGPALASGRGGSRVDSSSSPANGSELSGPSRPSVRDKGARNRTRKRNVSASSSPSPAPRSLMTHNARPHLPGATWSSLEHQGDHATLDIETKIPSHQENTRGRVAPRTEKTTGENARRLAKEPVNVRRIEKYQRRQMGSEQKGTRSPRLALSTISEGTERTPSPSSTSSSFEQLVDKRSNHSFLDHQRDDKASVEAKDLLHEEGAIGQIASLGSQQIRGMDAHLVADTPSTFTSPVTQQDVDNSRPDAKIGLLVARLTAIFADRRRYRQLLACRNSSAQGLLDMFQRLLDMLEMPHAKLRCDLIVASQRLAGKSGRYPACYDLKDVVATVGDYSESSGAFADIYRGSFDGRAVCLKTIRLDKKTDMQIFLKAYSKEAILWGQLSHLNLLPFYGIFWYRNRLSLVSPWMEHGDVNNYLRHHASANRVQLASDVAHGLRFLHRNGIIHGDLKGPNILVNEVGTACVADFGLSSVSDPNILAWTSHSSAHSKGGSVRWQAPELFDPDDDDDAHNTAASDVYAWSCVAYEMFTGHVPFTHLSRDSAVLLKVRMGERPTCPSRSSLSWSAWGLTEEIWSLMEDCWKSDPAERPTVGQVIGQLTPKLSRDHEWASGQERTLRPSRFRQMTRQSLGDDDLSVDALENLLKPGWKLRQGDPLDLTTPTYSDHNDTHNQQQRSRPGARDGGATGIAVGRERNDEGSVSNPAGLSGWRGRRQPRLG